MMKPIEEENKKYNIHNELCLLGMEEVTDIRKDTGEFEVEEVIKTMLNTADASSSLVEVSKKKKSTEKKEKAHKSGGIIYKIPFPNGKHYIGITRTSLKQRKKEHQYRTKKGKTKTYLYNALRKYEMGYTLELIEIDTANTLEELLKKEVEYIIVYNSFYKDKNGYNMTRGGDGCKDYEYTTEQKENCKKIQQKRKKEHPEISLNHSKFMKQRSKDNPNIGIQHAIVMTQLYENNPSKKEDMSKLKKQQNKDNPEMSRRQSEIKLMWFEDKNASELINKISKQSKKQWENSEQRQKIMDEKRKRFTKPFDVYKDGILIDSFDYVPDCVSKLFTINDGGISAVLNGRKKSYKGYVFMYK